MQHKRSRLTTKILAFVLILALVFPASAFASVADVAKDTVPLASPWQIPIPHTPTSTGRSPWRRMPRQWSPFLPT